MEDDCSITEGECMLVVFIASNFENIRTISEQVTTTAPGYKHQKSAKTIPSTLQDIWL